jgi:hypothetical protein
MSFRSFTKLKKHHEVSVNSSVGVGIWLIETSLVSLKIGESTLLDAVALAMCGVAIILLTSIIVKRIEGGDNV